MSHRVEFISIEEDDKDLIISFAIGVWPDVKSFFLHRTLFFQDIFDEEEIGVKVSYDGDPFEQENFNLLKLIEISDDKIIVKATFREYELDVSKVEADEKREMMRLLNKQNFDGRFEIKIADDISRSI